MHDERQPAADATLSAPSDYSRRSVGQNSASSLRYSNVPNLSLFPGADASDALRLASSTPFVELEWLFSFDSEIVLSHIVKNQAHYSGPMSFTRYKEEASERSVLSKLLAEEIKDINGEALHDLVLRSQYLVDLGPCLLPSSRFEKHYKLLSKLELSKLGELGDCALEIAAFPALAWKDSNKLGASSRLKSVRDLEGLVTKVQDNCMGKRLHQTALDALNSLTYAYYLVAQAFKVGISSAVLSKHALIFRRCQPHDWSNIDEMARMRFAGLTLHLTGQFFDFNQPFEAKLGFSQNTLADLRSIFRSSATRAVDSLRSHQWVYRWLADKLDAEVFSTRGNPVAWAQLSVLSETEQLAIVELARRFSSYRVPVTVDRLAAFILQFGTTVRIRAAIRLLTHLRFFPLWELSAAIESVLVRECGDSESKLLYVVPLGEQTGSTAIIRYLAAHSSLKNIVFTDDIKSALAATKEGDSLYFIDDCLLSGTQALSILGDWMGTRTHKPHHTVYSEALDHSHRKMLLKRKLVFAYCLATDIGEGLFFDGLHRTGLDKKQVRVTFWVREPHSSKAFEPLGPVGWASDEERQALKEFSSQVGFEILKERAASKGWDLKRQEESSLGFSNFQRLLVFPYNVPKTTLTLLWQTGRGDYKWQPLFPGYD